MELMAHLPKEAAENQTISKWLLRASCTIHYLIRSLSLSPKIIAKEKVGVIIKQELQLIANIML